MPHLSNEKNKSGKCDDYFVICSIIHHIDLS